MKIFSGDRLNKSSVTLKSIVSLPSQELCFFVVFLCDYIHVSILSFFFPRAITILVNLCHSRFSETIFFLPV